MIHWNQIEKHDEIRGEWHYDARHFVIIEWNPINGVAWAYEREPADSSYGPADSVWCADTRLCIKLGFGTIEILKNDDGPPFTLRSIDTVPQPSHINGANQ